MSQLHTLKEFIRRYIREVILLFVSLVCIFLAYSAQFVFVRQEPIVIQSDIGVETKDITPASENTIHNNIRVDVSGAVVNPGVYTLVQGDRVSDAIEAANGLSNSADVDFYARNYNAARTLTDQEKIYIPRIDEIENRVFIEGQYMIDHSLLSVAEETSLEQNVEEVDSSNSGIHINSADSAELETLSGIGPVTAQKIIEGRPYENVNDLVEKKIIGESVFNKIKNDISL